jgi:hypothetical protein
VHVQRPLILHFLWRWRYSRGPDGLSRSTRAEIPQEMAIQIHRLITGAAGRLHYSHGDDWMVLPVKLMFRSPRFAPLSATTPVGCSPAVAQIRLS